MALSTKLLKRTWERSTLSIETFVLALVILGTLAILEITVLSSLVTVVALLVIINFAKTLLQKCGYPSAGMGIGFAVGVGAFTFSSQILILIGVPPMLTYMSTIGAMVVFLIFDLFKKQKLSVLPERVSYTNTFMAIPVALLVAALRHPWMLPFALSVVFFRLRFRNKKINANQISLHASVLGIGWLVSSTLRPEKWWYFYADNDFQFFEALSWSIARWGVFEHPGFVGGSIAQYHWLSYGFFGGLTELASLEPWTALLKIAPLLSYFVLAELIIDVAPRAVNPNLPWGWIVLVFIVWLIRVNIVDSWAFSILIAVAFLRLAEVKIKVVNLRLIFLWLLLSGTLIFSKTSTSVVVAVVLALKVLWNRRQLRSPQLIPITSLVLFGIITVTLMSGGTAKYVFNFPARPTTKVLGDFLKSFLEYNMSFSGSRGLLPHVIIWLTTLCLFHTSTRQKFGTTGKVLLLLTPLCVTANLYFDGIYRYFLLTPHLILSIYIASSLLDATNFQSYKPLQNKKFISVELLLIGLTSGFIWRQKSVGLVLAEVFQSKFIFFLVAIVLLLICFLLVKMIDKTTIPNIGAALLISMAGVVFGFQIDDFSATKARGIEWYAVQENTESNFGTNDLIEVGQFIRNRTDQDLILASNNFSKKIKQGGANYLLPVETRRRFLLQGLRFQTGLAEPSIEQTKRMELSIDFAENPSSLSLKRLKEYGVEGYVVNLALTDRRDWSEFATELFRSGNFVFMMLK